MVYATSVNVYPDSIILKNGEWYYGLSFSIYPSNVSCCGVTWKSTNTSIVSVNESTGYLYATGVGTATVYAVTIDGSQAKKGCTVTVTNNASCVSSVTLSRSGLTLKKGNTYTLSAAVCPENATNRTLSWSTSNASVASINNGTVTAIAGGTARITATANDGSGKSDYCMVTVTQNTLVSSVTVAHQS